MAVKKLSLLIVLVAILLSVSFHDAFAVTLPTFPTCANPQGQVVASFDSGTHGVPGNTNTFTGKDTVFSLSDDTLMQCLCADNGDGIQTNWLDAAGMSQGDINVLVAQGWIYIPNGAAWGLKNDPYLAQNVGFACTPPQVGGGAGHGDGRSDGRSDGHSSAPAILAASIGSGQILGLASTGNSLFILTVILSGLVSLSLGFFLNSRKNK